MALVINKSKAELKTVFIPFGDDEIKIVYKPSEWTPKTTMDLQETEGAAQTEFSVNLLSKMIVEWDVLEDEGGPPMPITKKNLMALPQMVINAIIEGVTEHMRPKATKGRRSRDS